MPEGRERARVPYIEAGTAMRIALDKACRADLGPNDWRTLAGVLALLPSYSRVEDEVFLAQLGAVANVQNRRTLQRCIRRLKNAGVLEYEGRRGPGQPGLFKLSRGDTQGVTSTGDTLGVISTEARGDTSDPSEATPKVSHYREVPREETVVAPTNELIEAVRPLGHLTRAQLEDAARAWAESPESVRNCIADALERGDRPAALFMSLLAEGAHLASKPRTVDVYAIAERFVRGAEAREYDDEAIRDELGVLERRVHQTLRDDERARLLDIAREVRVLAAERQSLARAGAGEGPA